jgi:hypothetical protein
MVYDSARDRVVLFGGDTAAGVQADTWEYDGTTWTQRTITGPAARSGHAMVYDARRGKVLLFGGAGASGALADLWEYDGSAWTQVSAAGPPARQDFAMVYDMTRGVVMVTGGRAANADLADVWEYDGTAWRQPVAILPPPARSSQAAAYDGVRGGVLVFGGSALADSWMFHYERANDEAERCDVSTFDTDGDGLFGCADPDCWTRCTPECPPWTTALDTVAMTTVTWPAACAIAHPGAPRCGDGTCAAGLEDRRSCPADCP